VADADLVRANAGTSEPFSLEKNATLFGSCRKVYQTKPALSEPANKQKENATKSSKNQPRRALLLIPSDSKYQIQAYTRQRTKKKAPSELITATTRADVSDFQFKPGFGATIGHFRGSVFLRCYV
jgi:hypothetical protein